MPMMALFFCLLFVVPMVASMSTFKSSRQTDGTHSYQCPGKYVLNSPWYPDEEDCGCYYVCGIGGDAVRMCCPTGLWWEHDTKTCIYFQDFSTQKQEECLTLARGVGTTKQLREIFLGRCWEYQRFISASSFQQGYRNCDDLFDSFARVFVNKAACKAIKPADYNEVVEKSSMPLPPDSQVFWSGTYGLAQEYAAQGRRGYTLESTMIGYMLNDVTWCGATVAPGINFESCPAFASCPDHVMASFWAKALESYASQAAGVVTVILNGSRADGPAFRNNSFFAEHELPNLNPERVTRLRVWVAHDLDRSTTETCTSHGSIWTLKKIADAKGLEFECQDNPAAILHLLCAYQPLSNQCRFSHRLSRPVIYRPEPPASQPDSTTLSYDAAAPPVTHSQHVDPGRTNYDTQHSGATNLRADGDPMVKYDSDQKDDHANFKVVDSFAYNRETVTDRDNQVLT